MGQMRICIACGQTDDHPRDMVDTGAGVAYFHHDCHAQMDPPCPACKWLVEHKGDLVGQDWREHIGAVYDALTPEQFELPMAERDVVETHINGTVA